MTNRSMTPNESLEGHPTPNFHSVSLALKALFNNVFTLKNLSCMAPHAIGVFGKV